MQVGGMHAEQAYFGHAASAMQRNGKGMHCCYLHKQSDGETLWWMLQWRFSFKPKPLMMYA
jgi:hypothetical protein